MIIHVLRKPLTGTVAANVLAHGCGALNIDECRVGPSGATAKGNKPTGAGHATYGAGLHGNCIKVPLGVGRWPANLVHDGSAEVLGTFPEEAGSNSGQVYCADGTIRRRSVFWGNSDKPNTYPVYDKTRGSASRFFQQVTIE